ncbi:MAG: hypothetical protein JXQ75_13820, partial [Phycisphaerae bacterium]|nr:hypothetical protein [Phycisphaerae bacterium]
SPTQFQERWPSESLIPAEKRGLDPLINYARRWSVEEDEVVTGRAVMRVSFPPAAMAVLVLVGLAGPINADMTSGEWLLDQSNTFADGVDYGTVSITANDATGLVEFWVDASVVGDYGTLGNNFGIQSFGFNFQGISSTPDQWNSDLPAKWDQADGGGNMDGFGGFMVTEDGKGNSRRDPLHFTLTLPDAGEAVVSNFTVLSTDAYGQGPVFFAAHVAGFGDDGTGTGGYESHYIGGSTPAPAPVPAPDATLLGLMGLCHIVWMKRRFA